MTDTAERQGPANEQPSSEPGSERTLSRMVWDLTNHQVVGALVVTCVLAAASGLLGWVFTGGNEEDSNKNGGKTLTGSFRLSYNGELVFGETPKDLDSGVPTDSQPGGDVYFNYLQSPPTLDGVGGARIALYSESGTPTAARCDQVAQANGTPRLTVYGGRGQRVCIRSARGSVAVVTVIQVRYGYNDVRGTGTVWRNSQAQVGALGKLDLMRLRAQAGLVSTAVSAEASRLRPLPQRSDSSLRETGDRALGRH
ncbi:hypothetical protein [Actinomadura sp. 3N508]|uniref:hypothetical protein n=1 Tax=Actinomadura sp. 3N508 TaxID=3375153 RepID=UPI0037B2B2F1